MKFAHRITWSIGLNRGGVPYPRNLALEAVKRQLAARGIDGFTVTPGVGYWQGDREDCLTVGVLVVWGGSWAQTVAGSIAHDLARDLGQEAVAWSVDTLSGGGLAFR